jgi:hypothetical protein
LGRKGGFIPHSWLSKTWQQITGAPIVGISALKNRPKRLANYLVGHYLTGQSYERMSWSWKWVFRGFAGVWRRDFKDWYKLDKSKCLKSWNSLVVKFSSYVLAGQQISLGTG